MPQELPPADLDFAKIDSSTLLAVAKIVREFLHAPPSTPALDLLAKMQATPHPSRSDHRRIWRQRRDGLDGGFGRAHRRRHRFQHDETEKPAVTRQSQRFVPCHRPRQLERRARVGGEEFDVGEAAQEVDKLSAADLAMRAGHVPVRGELVPGPGSGARSPRCRPAPGQTGQTAAASTAVRRGARGRPVAANGPPPRPAALRKRPADRIRNPPPP